MVPLEDVISVVVAQLQAMDNIKNINKKWSAFLMAVPHKYVYFDIEYLEYYL